MKIVVPKLLLVFGVGAALACAQPTRTPPTPAQVAQHRVDMLTRVLTLDSGQQSAALGFFTTSATTDANVQAQMKTAREALQTDIEANNSANIAKDATEIGTLTAQMVQADATANAQFYQILNADQKSKYAGFLAGGGGRFGGPGPMGMGGPRGFGRQHQ